MRHTVCQPRGLGSASKERNCWRVAVDAAAAPYIYDAQRFQGHVINFWASRLNLPFPDRLGVKVEMIFSMSLSRQVSIHRRFR